MIVDTVKYLPPSSLRLNLGQTKFIDPNIVNLLCNKLLVNNNSAV